MITFEDETTIKQKPYIRKSMSLEREQNKIEHHGSRTKFSAYISVMTRSKIDYDFYDKMISANTIDQPGDIKTYVMKNYWKKLITRWGNASLHASKIVQDCVNSQKDWLTVIRLPPKAPSLNPNERKVNQHIKSDVCAKRFFTHIEEQKGAVSEPLGSRFGTWNNDRHLAVPILTSILIFLIGSNTHLTFGHNFSSNESAIFLALVDTMKEQAQLVQENLARNNISLASQHADKALAFLTDNITKEIAERNQRLATDLKTALTTLKTSTETSSGNGTTDDINFLVSDIDGILDEIVTARIDPELLNNSTIQALRMVELLDKVLSNYGDAYAVGFDMTNMSMMMGSGGSSSSSSSSDGMQSMSSMDMGTDGMSMGKNMTTSEATLSNITDYQTAQVLATKAQELFDSQLINASLAKGSGTEDQSIDSTAAALKELVTNIDNKASPMEIMTIVHTKLHPNLLTAYGLKLE